MVGGSPLQSPLLRLSILAVAVTLLVGTALVGGRILTSGPHGVASVSNQPTPSSDASPTPNYSDAQGMHTVRSGESLFSVASDFGITYDELRYWNRDRYPSLDNSPVLERGWILEVTGPALPTALPTATPILEVPSSAGPPPGGVALVTLPALSTSVWGGTVRYFSISGRNPNELIASAEQNIPAADSGRAPKDAAGYVEPTTWDLQPTYVINTSNGSCTITGVSSHTAYRATIPRWTSPKRVPSSLLSWWKSVLDHIGWHEGQHVHIFVTYVSSLTKRLVGQACSSWQVITNKWAAELNAAQAAFDAHDRATWTLPAYSGPWYW